MKGLIDNAPSALDVSAAVPGMPVIENLLERPACRAFVEKVPIGFARRHRVLGLESSSSENGSSNSSLTVAICDSNDLTHLQMISRFLGRPVQPVLVRPDDLAAAINVAYQQRVGQAQSAIDDIDRIEKLDRREVLSEIDKLAGREDLLDVSSRAPVIKLVSLMLFEGVQARRLRSAYSAVRGSRRRAIKTRRRLV